MKTFLRMKNGKIYKYSGINEYYWSLDEYGDDEIGASKFSPGQVLSILRNNEGELVEKVEFKPKIVWPRVFTSVDCHGIWIMKSERNGIVYDFKNHEVANTSLGVESLTKIRNIKELTGEARQRFINSVKN